MARPHEAMPARRPLGVRIDEQLTLARGIPVLVDLFAGGGGTSTGGVKAAVLLELGVPGVDWHLIAINHDEKAIQTHELNHPWAQHIRDDVENVNPEDVLQGRRILLLLASPPCTHFSTARGGKPKDEQQRATPRYILRWIEVGQPLVCLFENVPEFEKWGPLDEHGKAIKAKRGETFKEFLQDIERLTGPTGKKYRCQHKVLNAADYGDPQSRKRLFIQVRCDDQPFTWPKQTHSKGGKAPGTKPWRGAIEVLNLDEPTKSIFGRKRPLSVKTRRRISRGIRSKGRFWEPLAASVEADAGPVPMRRLLEACPTDEWPRSLRVALTLGQQGGAMPRDASEPLATIASAGYVRLAEARFILPVDGPGGNGTNNPPRDVEDPLATIRAERGAGHVVEPMLFHVTHPDDRPIRSPSEPFPTITGANRGELAISEPFLVQTGGPERAGEKPREVSEPFGTLLTRDHLALADPRLIISVDRPETNRSLAKGVDEPLPTLVANNDRVAVVEPFLVPAHGERPGQEPRFHPASEPLPTLPAARLPDVVVVRLVTTYNGNGQTRDATEPFGTQTTVERHAVVEVSINDLWADCGLRMVTVREAAGGQSFPSWYRFVGTKRDMMKQIGNAVPVNLAAALIFAALAAEGAPAPTLHDFEPEGVAA